MISSGLDDNSHLDCCGCSCGVPIDLEGDVTAPSGSGIFEVLLGIFVLFSQVTLFKFQMIVYMLMVIVSLNMSHVLHWHYQCHLVKKTGTSLHRTISEKGSSCITGRQHPTSQRYIGGLSAA